MIARIDATVAHLADALSAQGHPGTLDERRVLAVLLMANPAQALALLRMHRQGAGGQGDGRGADGFVTGLRPSSTTADRPPEPPEPPEDTRR